MALVEYDDEEQRRQQEQAQQVQVQGAPELPRATQDWGAVESRLRQMGGGLYDPSDLEGFKRNLGYDNPTASLDQMFANAAENYAQRNAPTSHRPYDSQTSDPIRQQANRQADQRFSPVLSAISSAQSGTSQPGGASRFTFNANSPGFQFDDPYTRQLEDGVRQQLNSLQQPQSNPALDQLLSFLGNQFQSLSTAPGYSPEDLAVMRTQFLEPIERDRAANAQRVMERTSSRGMLPSSGLHEESLQRLVDQPAEQQRIAAQRDIAIDAINRRRADLNQATQVGSLAGIQIPQMQRQEDQQRRAEILQLLSLLYDLPSRALQENMSVINGTPGPESLFNQSIQLQNAQAQQTALNQNKWAQIGQMLAGLEF